jgi:hypothetical protein
VSHSSGKISVRGVHCGYFEYNGTSDFAMPRIYRTIEEVSDNWRNKLGLQPDYERRCQCDNLMVVDCHADYGGGIEWQGTACFSCMELTERLDPYGTYALLPEGEISRSQVLAVDTKRWEEENCRCFW